MHNIRILGAPVCQPCHLLTFSQDRPFQTILKFLQFFWQQFSPTFGLTNDWEVSFEPKHDNILPIMYHASLVYIQVLEEHKRFSSSSSLAQSLLHRRLYTEICIPT